MVNYCIYRVIAYDRAADIAASCRRVCCCFEIQALADAIFSVTEMNPDLTVAKIEIQTKSEEQ